MSEKWLYEINFIWRKRKLSTQGWLEIIYAFRGPFSFYWLAAYVITWKPYMSRQVNTLKYNVPLDELGAPSDPLIFFQVVLVEIFCLMQVKTSIF